MSYWTTTQISGSVGITQDVHADPLNSSSGSLTSSASFVGVSSSTLGVAGIQVSLKTNQNADVWIEQSPDGNNWDISDLYTYKSNSTGFGITVQAVSSYYRVIVKNTAPFAQTYMRLQSALCPVVESLPRTLSKDGHLKTDVMGMSDSYGFEVENTPTDEMRTVIPYRLVGSSFSGSVIDTNYWTATAGSVSGSVVGSSAQVILTTGSSTSGSSSLQSFRTARYMGGTSLKFRTTLRLPDIGKTGNIRRWGAFSTTNGAFYQLSGSSLSLVTRKESVDSPIDSGTFNGDYGYELVLDTTVKTWEIYWTNSKVYFTLGGELIHTFTASNDTWTDTLSLPIRYENISGSTTNMNVRSGTIYRLGSALSQPTSYYHANGQTTGVNLKFGTGNLHSVVVNAVTNGAVMTLADSVNAGTPIITAMTASNTTTTPYTIDFKGLPFFNGLRLIVASQNASLTVIYE